MDSRTIDKSLFDLFQSYAALESPKFLSFPRHLLFHDIIDFCLEFLLLNPHFQTYPPSTRYQRSFWKWAIENLEACSNEDDEIDGRIYHHYLSLLEPIPSSTVLDRPQPPPLSYVTRYWRTSCQPCPEAMVDLTEYNSITVLESRTTIESGTTGLRTWMASLRLSQYLIYHPEIVFNKTVLELGCGSGFLGIVAASLQLQNDPSIGQPKNAIFLTDNNSEVLARCCHNVQLPCNISSNHPELSYHLLDWNELCLQSFSDVEVVLGADIVFDPCLIDPLVQILHTLLSVNLVSGVRSRLAIIALTIRQEDTIKMFLETIGKFMIVQDLPLPPAQCQNMRVADSTIQSDREVRIYKITSKRE